jgi:uncharacterized protein YjbI with pentapeptide repeats
MADFFRATFSETVNFVGATFSEGASFRVATFSKPADFSGATFSKPADFSGATFSEGADFSNVTFSEIAYFSSIRFTKEAHFVGVRFSEASFREATFSKPADFSWATFSKRADFFRATFSESADFSNATFSEGADFRSATFSETASFSEATFSKPADFSGATFSKPADFFWATFSEGANFLGATFNERASFRAATFSETTLFVGRRRPGSAQAGRIFAGAVVDFRQVAINPPDVITFRRADLKTCQFLDTDLRKVQLDDVRWPQKGGRVLIYDEIASTDSEDEDGSMRPWAQIERLYRALKQNYEDRRDYERAGDFHYGEKEMRRQNPDTARGLRLFLMLYWLFSGYGERYLRPLIWAGLLFVGSTIGYLWWGLRPKEGGPSLAWINGWDWLRGAYYSFRVMTFLKPDDWVPLRYAQVVNTVQTLLAPIFLGLFALALRQRLKR